MNGEKVMANIYMEYFIFKKDTKEIDFSSRDILSMIGNLNGNELTIDNFIIKYNEKELGHTYILSFEATYLTRNEKCIDSLERLERDLRIASSRNGMHVTIYKDGISKILSTKVFPSLVEYERKLRKLIYIVFLPKFGHEWIEKTFNKEMKDSTKSNGINETKLTEGILELLELYQLESYLFDENMVDFEDENGVPVTIKINEIEKEKLIEYISMGNLMFKKKYSLWEEFFSEHVDIENFQKLMSEIRDKRNIVAHNKTFRSRDFKVLCKNLNKFLQRIEETLQKFMSDGFEFEGVDTLAEDLQSFQENKLGSQETEGSAVATLPDQKHQETLNSVISPVWSSKLKWDEQVKPATLAMAESLGRFQETLNTVIRPVVSNKINWNELVKPATLASMEGLGLKHQETLNTVISPVWKWNELVKPSTLVSMEGQGLKDKTILPKNEISTYDESNQEENEQKEKDGESDLNQ
jgi:hypothetical protein